MAEQGSEKIKLYITIGLAVILAISGYFRLIHPKMKRAATASPSPPVAASPEIAPDLPVALEKKASPEAECKIAPLPSGVRDIFKEPVISLSDPPTEQNRPNAPFASLKGTIVGGADPIAIINGRFMRIGDGIGEYRVVRIEKDQVRLRSENHEIVLEVLQHAHK